MILEELIELTRYHRTHCTLYDNYVSMFFGGDDAATSLASIPYLPVRVFKEFELKSIPDEGVFKTMTSSGTGGVASRIYLDRETASLQSKSLIKIFTDAFGQSRYPMLVIDSESTVKDRNKFSARTAAVNGFSLFSRNRCFALNEDLTLDVQRVREFLLENRGQRVFVFGFTFLVWKNFVSELIANSLRLDLSNGFILHGGGWKKLREESVSDTQFRESILELTGCSSIRNYYGMVEQTGTIFLECEYGLMHSSSLSDALTRDPLNFKVLADGEEGLIQVFSTIQKSYPGHSLLTEDVGTTNREHSCPCGNTGTSVIIRGRLENAEVRGCSDTRS